MAKDNKVDENPDAPVEPEKLEPNTEEPEAPEVEGELIENPNIEETDEEPAEPEEPEAPAAEVEVEEEETPPEPDAPPVPTTAVNDPGEFKPGDHSFTITVDGTRHKITSIDEADALVDKIEDAKQLIRFMDKRADLRDAIKKDEEQWQTSKQEFETQQEVQKVRDEQVTQWNNEVNYLRSKGLLPEITPELNSANWADPKVAEQEPVKETLAIFQWMEKENAARKQAGISEVTSAVDAYTMMKAESQDTSAKAEKAKETETRQKKGSMVTGNSAFIPETEQKGMITGEGGNLRDLERELLQI